MLALPFEGFHACVVEATGEVCGCEVGGGLFWVGQVGVVDCLSNFVIHFHEVNGCQGCSEDNEDADDGEGDVGVGVF